MTGLLSALLLFSLRFISMFIPEKCEFVCVCVTVCGTTCCSCEQHSLEADLSASGS